jgi:hypothetical protein
MPWCFCGRILQISSLPRRPRAWRLGKRFPVPAELQAVQMPTPVDQRPPPRPVLHQLAAAAGVPFRRVSDRAGPDPVQVHVEQATRQVPAALDQRRMVVPAGGSDYPYVDEQPSKCSEAKPGPIGPAGNGAFGAADRLGCPGPSAARRPLPGHECTDSPRTRRTYCDAARSAWSVKTKQACVLLS